MDRRRFLAGSGAVMAAALTGCTAGSKSSSSSGGDVELSFLTFETPNLDAAYWDAAIRRASEQVPGAKIKKLVSPVVDRTAYVKQLDSSGQMPDIMPAINPQGFAQAGKLAAFTPQELTEFIWPRSNAIDGKIYQLPYNTQAVPLVYYNKALFAKAGISAPPTTYADFLEVCAKLKAKAITPIVVGGGGKDTWADMYPLIAAIATDVYKGDPRWLAERAADKKSFDDHAFVKAVDKVAQLAKKGYIDKAGLSRSYADTEKAFRDGKGAMYPMGSWFPASADAKKPGFEVGVFAWPADDGSLVVPAFTGGGLSVSAKAPDVELARKWALAFQLDKTNLDAIVKSDGAIIAIKGYQPPKGMGPIYQDTLAVYEQALKKGRVTTAFSQENGDGSLLPGLSDKAALGVQDLITGKKSANQFARFLDSEWTKAEQ
ncbi:MULTISPECIES: extracellular solute-binding protein [Streptomyces violaceusniger group]|uniref:Extracellular solute-binding protein n=1 Tax=Streptomyces rhizosphaericus TaxID=114699 RepID=A0ABN1S8M2_9ACTN|nr:MULTISPECIES: extracellular solute-binding protein [Streptomyces violaceusniger group]